jgi:hypothetical protein
LEDSAKNCFIQIFASYKVQQQSIMEDMSSNQSRSHRENEKPNKSEKKQRDKDKKKKKRKSESSGKARRQQSRIKMTRGSKDNETGELMDQDCLSVASVLRNENNSRS